MRVLLTGDHRYPASRYPARGMGRASARVLDLLARGLAELGHTVFYALAGGDEESLPGGVIAATERSARHADVVHHQRLSPYESGTPLGRPWVRTVHADLLAAGHDRARLSVSENWIYVSRALARTFGSERWIHNGLDPAEYVYSRSKGDDFLFVAALDRAWDKGLDLALAAAGAAGRRLIIAGSAPTAETHQRVLEMCRGRDACLVGEVAGAEKAELFASARALIAPSRMPEAFGLVCVEALISGTPVICSDRGGLPEIVSGDVGVVCRSYEELIAAAQDIERIQPARCRAYALERFHYHGMAERYVAEYEKTIAAFTPPLGSRNVVARGTPAT
jgi:glycosyltransferase involved in cell wall biosynthesis